MTDEIIKEMLFRNLSEFQLAEIRKFESEQNYILNNSSVRNVQVLGAKIGLAWTFIDLPEGFPLEQGEKAILKTYDGWIEKYSL